MNIQMGSTVGTATIVNFATATIKFKLLTSAVAPVATWTTRADDTGTEVTGTNYTAGGATLTGQTLTQSGGITTFTANNITWAQSASGFNNARYGYLYVSTGTAANDTIIGFYDFLTNQSNQTVPFNAIFDPTYGIIQWA